MTWQVEYSPTAAKSLKKLDKPVAARIVAYLDEVGTLDDPRSRGKELVGNLAGLWSYRIGRYRAICDIYDDVFVIIAVDIGHRSDIYDD